MTALLQSTINFSALHRVAPGPSYEKPSYSGFNSSRPRKYFVVLREKTSCFHRNSFKSGVYKERLSFIGVKDGISMVLDERKRKKRVVLVRFNQGFNGLGGGGGGGWKNDSNAARVLGNLALAIGLTYLSMTGQLGWVLDAIVSVWLLAVLLPIVGLGALLWWAGRDIVQGSCPNCGNDFQVLKSTLDEDLQLCPFCSQPFSVVDDEFVKDPVKFFNQSTMFGQAFSDFSTRSKQGKDSPAAVVDVEAEVKDAE